MMLRKELLHDTRIMKQTMLTCKSIRYQMLLTVKDMPPFFRTGIMLTSLMDGVPPGFVKMTNGMEMFERIYAIVPELFSFVDGASIATKLDNTHTDNEDDVKESNCHVVESVMHWIR